MPSFELALKARIPVIEATTSDLINLAEVLSFLSPTGKASEFVSASGLIDANSIFYSIKPITITAPVYERLVDRESVLVLVNPVETSPFAFSAGEIPVPRKMLEALLQEALPKEQVEFMLPYFRGLTLKTTAEVIRLTTAKYKSLTPLGVREIRSLIAGKLNGLDQVEIKPALYLCPTNIAEWIKVNRDFFLKSQDPRLIPRGLVMAGEPGTGKTSAAKHIAKSFGLPLYRLDLSGALSKWVGESEAKLARVLSLVESESPCVLLIDEVEKLFSGDESGVTPRLLSQMLWWLAEHTCRILTVMTTNDLKKLPPELYRAGRMDTVFTIHPLTYPQAVKLAFSVMEQFISPLKEEVSEMLTERMRVVFSASKSIPHADVVQFVYELIKQRKLIAP